jgi:hypothetical protein
MLQSSKEKVNSFSAYGVKAIVKVLIPGILTVPLSSGRPYPKGCQIQGRATDPSALPKSLTVSLSLHQNVRGMQTPQLLLVDQLHSSSRQQNLNHHFRQIGHLQYPVPPLVIIKGAAPPNKANAQADPPLYQKLQQR